MLFVALLSACDGCRPNFPEGDDDSRSEDTPPPADDTSGDSAPETGDSGPPARCDFEEVEPNGPPDDTQLLPMEAWACGVFGTYVDFDSFRIEPSQPGWIKVQVEAASRGSPANPQLVVEGGGQTVQVLDGYLTTDPLLVFPAEAATPYSLLLGETDFFYGEDYGWYMLTSLTKAPVDWDSEEAEPNEDAAEAMAFPLGDTVFAGVSSVSDLDWYRITTPYDGEQTLTFTVTAFKEGSAADIKLLLYDSDGVTLLREKRTGDITYDRDPAFTKKITGQKDLYLLARTEDGRGSRFHWYTLSISVDAE